MGKKDGTCAAVRLIEDVRLIWGPLTTGLTVKGLTVLTLIFILVDRYSVFFTVI